MVEVAQLEEWYAQIHFDERLNVTEGLDPFRDALRDRHDASVLSFLSQRYPGADGGVRVGVAFVLAEHYLRTGESAEIRRLFDDEADALVRESVLNGLGDEPPSPAVSADVLALAAEALGHSNARVRAEACRVVQGQAAWRQAPPDLAVPGLLRCSSDDCGVVRMQAACAIGNLAKQRVDFTSVVPALSQNLEHGEESVRRYSAWALWQLSRAKHDIAAAVGKLAALAGTDGESSPVLKESLGALLHHARKSDANRAAVRVAVAREPLNRSHKRVDRFLSQLVGELP